MNSGPNHPSGNNPGGRGRRRRRGRRGHGGQPGQGQGRPQGEGNQQQTRSGGGQSHPSRAQNGPSRGPQNRRGPMNKNRRGRSVNPKAPDAGIFSAPMDHSYRTAQDGNGNGNGRGPRAGFGRQFQHPDVEAVSSSNGNSKPIYAFVDDLFFLAKIQETARKLNIKVEFVKGDKEAIDAITSAEEKPSLIIFDLNSTSGKPLTVIPKLKSKLKKATNIIGFLSHLQSELKMKAQEAGCDMVLPRSAFSQNLPQLLRRHATDEFAEETQ